MRGIYVGEFFADVAVDVVRSDTPPVDEQCVRWAKVIGIRRPEDEFRMLKRFALRGERCLVAVVEERNAGVLRFYDPSKMRLRYYGEEMGFSRLFLPKVWARIDDAYLSKFAPDALRVISCPAFSS